MHVTYLNSQLIITYIYINIKRKIKGNTRDKAENTKNAVSTLFFEHQYLPYYSKLTAEIFNTYSQHSNVMNCVPDFLFRA